MNFEQSLEFRNNFNGNTDLQALYDHIIGTSMQSQVFSPSSSVSYNDNPANNGPQILYSPQRRNNEQEIIQTPPTNFRNEGGNGQIRRQQNEEEYYIRNRQEKHRSTTTIFPQTEDTKNFLQFFRSPSQKLLKKYFRKDELETEPAYNLFHTSISQDNLRQLYMVKKFQPFFRRYFTKNQIYRDLIKSKGILLKNKKKFIKKLRFFQDTFDQTIDPIICSQNENR